MEQEPLLSCWFVTVHLDVDVGLQMAFLLYIKVEKFFLLGIKDYQL